MAQEIIKAAEGRLATNTEKKFYAILAQYNLASIKSMELAVSTDTPAIGELMRQFGKTPVRAYIKGCIVSLRDFVNLKGAMTDDQTDMTADMILDEFPNVTIADVVLIFRRAKLGQYGDLYARLDGQIILSWFGKYFAERCVYFAEKSIGEANSRTMRYKDTPARVSQLINAVIKTHKVK